MVHILDNYYLAITFLVSLALQAGLLAFAFLCQSDKLTDLGGSLNFFLIALLTLCAGNTYSARQVVASVLVMVWAVRLGGFLCFRVFKTGKCRGGREWPFSHLLRGPNGSDRLTASFGSDSSGKDGRFDEMRVRARPPRPPPSPPPAGS